MIMIFPMTDPYVNGRLMLTFGVHGWSMLPYIAYMDPMGIYSDEWKING